MEEVLLINFEDILTYTQINGSVDRNKLSPHIYNSQILYLEPLLGSSLYEKLLSLVSNDAIETQVNTDYKTLLYDYITPSLVFHTLEFFNSFNSFQMYDGGVYQHSANNANNSTLDDIEKISVKYKIIANKYDSKLSKYLCENSNLFPEYVNNTGLIDKITNSSSFGFFTGMSNVKNNVKR